MNPCSFRYLAGWLSDQAFKYISSALQAFLNRFGKGVDVHLEAKVERRFLADAITHASVCAARNGLMELERISPEGLIAKRVKAKSILAFIQPRRATLTGLTPLHIQTFSGGVCSNRS